MKDKIRQLRLRDHVLQHGVQGWAALVDIREDSVRKMLKGHAIVSDRALGFGEFCYGIGRLS